QPLAKRVAENHRPEPTIAERLQINESTFWAGGPYQPVNPDAFRHLEKVRQLVFDGRYAEAEAMAERHLMAQPIKQMSHQPVGDLHIE
ncbi:glycoside hydrolase N-terminal domain-containing protein, partial [Rhizobium ruizarguesonis]